MQTKRFPLALIVFIALVGLTGCSSSISSSSPRFTHVDVDGSPPFVFFDQETKQVCWGLTQIANGSKVTITVRVKPTNDPVEISIPVCKDLK
jgi:hypothetical protein